MHVVIDKLVEIIKAAPNFPAAADHLGVRKPADGSDLPAVAISLLLSAEQSVALNRFVRSSNSMVKSIAVLPVQASVDTFSDNLKRLRLAPLPLRKHPASVRKEFTSQDLQVTNITDRSHPIEYHLTGTPASPKEFKVDAARAQIEFGAAQTVGDLLQIAHWTVTWRDDIVVDRFQGAITLEVWAQSFEHVDGLARRLQETLGIQSALLKKKGFLKLHPYRLEAAERISLNQSNGTAAPAWCQKLEYHFFFEAELGGELSSGIPIKKIEVTLEDFPQETISLR